MKKRLLNLVLVLLTVGLTSCSTEEENVKKTASIQLVNLYNLPSNLTINNVVLPNEYHRGLSFEVETGDVIRATALHINIYINNELVLNTQGYGEYIVE